MGEREGGIDLHGALVVHLRLRQAEAALRFLSELIGPVRLDVLGGNVGNRSKLRGDQRPTLSGGSTAAGKDLARQLGRHLIHQGEGVGATSPRRSRHLATLHVDQAGVQGHVVAAAENRSPHHVPSAGLPREAHRQIVGDRLGALTALLAQQVEQALSAHHAQSVELRQSGGKQLGQSLSEPSSGSAIWLSNGMTATDASPRSTATSSLGDPPGTGAVAIR